MGRKRLQPADIAEILRKVDGLIARGWSIGEAVKSLGVTEAAYFRWCAEQDGVGERLAEQSRRVKVLEAENARLRLALADHRLDQLILRRVVEDNF